MKKSLLLLLASLCGLNLLAQKSEPENPLKNLAEYNLQDVNTFARPDDAGKAWGKLFQFGRNIPFDYNETIDLFKGRIASNDSRVWGREFFMRVDGNDESFDWCQDDVSSDTWHTIVAKAAGAPIEYTGQNAGDPCPKGYHMPKKTELAAFFPSSFASANFSGELGKKTITEELTIDGKTGTYQAEYLSDKKNVIYGIKYIGGDNARRTAYCWIWNGAGVSVVSRLIGADDKYKSVEDIKARDFWEDHMADYIKRELPASGMISGYTGMPAQRYDNAYLWSSEAASAKGYAWALWAYPADDEAYSEGGVSPYDEAVGRYTAVSIRCVRDAQAPITTAKVTLRPQVGSQEGGGRIEAEYTIGDGSPILVRTNDEVPLGAKITARAIPIKECSVKNLLIDGTHPVVEGDKLAVITDPITGVVTYTKESLDKDFLFEPFFEKISAFQSLSIPLGSVGQMALVYNAIGVLVDRIPPNNVASTVTIGAYPAGVYFVRIGQEVYTIVKH